MEANYEEEKRCGKSCPDNLFDNLILVERKKKPPDKTTCFRICSGEEGRNIWYCICCSIGYSTGKEKDENRVESDSIIKRN